MTTQKWRRWTKDETSYLIKFYSTIDMKILKKKLDRTERQIAYKAHKLGLIKGWTDEEIEYLENNYYRLDTKTLAKKLGRTETAIRAKANRFKIYKYKDCIY